MRSGRKLIAYDRRLGVRYVAGADEAGRGSLAGPLVAAGVLLDYGELRGRRAAALGLLNDSKQLDLDERERLFQAVLVTASRVSVQLVSSGEIDRSGLHRSNLARSVRGARRPRRGAEVRLVDGFRLGPAAPPHRAVVDGDAKSAAIAAASVVAKVIRDRPCAGSTPSIRASGSLATSATSRPAHSACRPASRPVRASTVASFDALCYVEVEPAAVG